MSWGYRVLPTLGLAFACAQSMLDRSGISLYGGVAFSLPSLTIWYVQFLTALLAVIALYRLPRAGNAAVAVFACLSGLAGSMMVVSSNWGIGSGTQLLVDMVTTLLVCSHAVTFQLGVSAVVSEPEPARSLVAAQALCFALTLGSLAFEGEALIACYVLLTLGGPTCLAVHVFGPQARGADSQAGRLSGDGARLLPREVGMSAFIGFCAFQTVPTILSGFVCAIEMFVPFQASSFPKPGLLAFACLLLGLAVLLRFKQAIPSTMLPVVTIMVAPCVSVPLGVSDSFIAKPLFMLISNFCAFAGYLNICRFSSKHGLEATSTAYVGQAMLFFGMIVGTSASSELFGAVGIESIAGGRYLGVVLASLFVALALFVAMALLVLAPQGQGVSGGAASSADAHLGAFAERYGLTSREAEIARGIYLGYSRRRIAEGLSVSEATVKSHINTLYGKVGVHKRDELLDAIRQSAPRERGGA